MKTLFSKLIVTIGNMPTTILAIWSVFALLMLIAVLVSVWCEMRYYTARNKAGAWLFVRLSTLPIAAVGIAAVFISARAVGGPEALAVFYLLAITACPLIYFGLHWFAGFLAGFGRKDALAIGLSGLLMLLLPVLLANQAQQWVFDLARAIDGTGSARDSKFTAGKKKPPQHQVVDQQRFILPEIGEVWTEHWQQSPGVHVERVELEVRGQFVEVDSSTSNYLCMNGEDVHVFWHGSVAPANWRVHWRDVDGKRFYSDHTMLPPSGAVVDFIPEWLADGFTLPVRVPSGMITYTWKRENGRDDSRGALDQSPNASTKSICLLTLRRPVTVEQPQINGLGIRLWRFDTQQMLYTLFRRPDITVGEDYSSINAATK